jgi:site-specific DNA-methyltransferase (adenine-specific)
MTPTPLPAVPDEILTVKDVASLLKLAAKTVCAMANAGEIPGFKVRGQGARGARTSRVGFSSKQARGGARMTEATGSTTGDRDLEALLADLSVETTTAGRWMRKAEVVSLLAKALQGTQEAAFAQIRTAAKGSGFVGKIAVHCAGERRGTRYAFGERPAPPPGQRGEKPTPIVDRADAPLGGIRDFPVPACPIEAGTVEVVYGDNLDVIRGFGDQSFDLIYVDPPFNTGRSQSRTRIRTERDDEGDRAGFHGRRYRTTVVGVSAYADSFADYMAFLVPRLAEAHRLLKPNGSFFLHLDYREVHYAKVALDQIFGRESFVNEIIWAYDYGARATNRWSPKHDNILWYARDPSRYCFNFDEVDRIPYMAPSLVGEEKAARGKTPTDTWWHTIVSPNGKEKTGYPTQKPLGILSRIVRIHSRPGDRLLDFFAGSGSFGEAAASHGRNVTLVDHHREAIEVMRRRFANYDSTFRTSDSTIDASSTEAVAAESDSAAHDANGSPAPNIDGGSSSSVPELPVADATSDLSGPKKGPSLNHTAAETTQGSVF